ncbi:nucleolar pre-ribosomal-associated protein 1 [Maniola hyperantus]|uniref:nucleolar pre-ribosomal-associated protein 1 n=1 Tax=Aphantopus hyperantus TaxID=2795564 RepID=UPI00156868D7|nr:uncharacterized protein LOC117991529 [Maniola hyperantus]
MGKRKYDGESKDSSKRNRSESITKHSENYEAVAEQPQNDETAKIKAPKPTLFDIKHFRKELAGKQGQTMALTQFLQVCLNPDSDVDYMLEYLKVGGNSHEILRQISPDNKKNLSLATPAFHLFHLIILKVQSSLPHMIVITEEACRYFLNTFIPTVEIMISENSGPRHRKIILSLLMSMVTLSPDLGVEVLNQVPLTPKSLQHIVEKPNYKEKDNVRTSFVHFMTSFLVDGHLPLIKALLEKQGLLSLVIPGLVHDEAFAVLMFLNTLKKNVIDNTLISKTLKLKTFSHQVLHNMFKLFTWKGPPESNNEQTPEAREEIMTLLSDIILTLFTSHKLGLYFLDHSLGTTDANKNQNLYKALQTLKRPWENKHQGEIVLEIVYRCPDLHRAIINVIEQSFQPQHSPMWEKTIEFVISLLEKLKPENMVTKLTNLNPAQTANFIRFITMPVPLLKLINTGIGIDQTISLYCMKVLVKMLQSLKRYMQLLEQEDSPAKILELKNKLENFLPKHMPAQDTIVSLMTDIIKKQEEMEVTNDYRLPKITNADSLLSLLEVLLLNYYINPASCEALEESAEMKLIVDSCMSTGSTILKYKAICLCQILCSLSSDNPMFKYLFFMILEVYTSDEDDTWIEAKDTMQLFFKSTDLYESDEDEVYLMLYALRNTKIDPISIIAEVVDHVSESKMDFGLQDSEEGTQSNLDALFDDLMRNKNNVGSVFLATKIPSQFIMRCIHFIDSDKGAKKTLKGFLNLYVANLLHHNYSPDLTEVMIGDCKLDVRSYLADWTTKPTAIPDAIGIDETLKNISKSIIENEDIPLTTIFPLIESSEKTDLKLLDVPYEIDMTKPINSTDLFIWAKYLMFCVVRLTQLGLYTVDQQKKILTYFEIIIALAKENHMVNICRDIILNLFRNSHFLGVYQPVDFGKSPSNILATEFMLQIIEQNKDIVNYLNKKYSVLRSYQQKTSKEITKAFIKVNKKKHVSSDLILKVLNTIGLSNEEDLIVFEALLGIDIEVLCSKDREPSLVFDLLRVLLEKYAKSVTREIPNDTLKKCLTLYFTLLTYQDITPNLTNIEESLIKYFENKPHQAIQISEADFKKFFYANTVRKTTSQLALVLLKYNIKFCNIFKEEINRPEVLSQREVTLPLGNALINHNQFLVDDKDILKTIYEEYKSNIKKFLEKPHKAGQVYINSSRFLTKLVIECMDVQDCEKIFSKNNKFETAELSHIELLQVVFLKFCLSEEYQKKEYLINYFLSMLNMAVIAMKSENESKTHILDALSKNMIIVLQISKAINVFQVNEKQDFKKVTESGIWQNFCKCVLKDSLKVRTLHNENVTEPKLLCLLSCLVKMFYPYDHEDIVNLFDMVTSHSEFLNVMLSHHSQDIKLRLLEFLFTLISTNKSVMKTQHIPVYLSGYHATRSRCDRLILSILQFYEANDLPVNEYKPYIWGDSAANHYAVRKSRTSTLWGHPTPNQVMSLFDKETIEKTIKYFPVNQKLDYNFQVSNACFNETSVKNFLDRIVHDRKAKNSKDVEEAINNLVSRDEVGHVLALMREKDVVAEAHVEEDNDIYDPAFIFPLLSHLLAPGSVASSFKLLRCGLLSVPVMGLSSQCGMMRAAAYHVLHRFHLLLETETRHKNDKLLLTDFITTLRQSLSSAMNSPAEGELNELKNPKLPAIGALYLARALMVSTSPTEPLYKPVNNFLIAKQFVDLTVVPDFLSLFHDSDVESLERRLWILDIIKDGTKTMTDVNVVFKTMCIKMIMDFYNTTIADKKTKLKILGALNSMVAIPRAFEILVEGYGIMPWLHFVVRNIEKGNTAILKGTFVFIENMIYSMALHLFARHCGKFYSESNLKIDGLTDFKVKSDIEYEILSTVYELLPHIELLNVEDVVSYVKLYNLITKRWIKFLSKKQILNVVAKCSERLKSWESVKFIHQAVLLNNSVMLNSQVLSKDIVTGEDRLISELKNLVRTYTS